MDPVQNLTYTSLWYGRTNLVKIEVINFGENCSRDLKVIGPDNIFVKDSCMDRQVNKN